MKKENLGAYCASNDLSLPKKTDKCIKINWQKDMEQNQWKFKMHTTNEGNRNYKTTSIIIFTKGDTMDV